MCSWLLLLPVSCNKNIGWPAEISVDEQAVLAVISINLMKTQVQHFRKVHKCPSNTLQYLIALYVFAALSPICCMSPKCRANVFKLIKLCLHLLVLCLFVCVFLMCSAVSAIGHRTCEQCTWNKTIKIWARNQNQLAVSCKSFMAASSCCNSLHNLNARNSMIVVYELLENYVNIRVKKSHTDILLFLILQLM